MAKKYDIFISYRRNGGQETARILRDALAARGYRVFFDVETLRSGAFNEALLTTIQQCDDFLLVCSPGALDRCAAEDDWVRRELECAFEHGKNIVPILLRGFEFPPAEALPPSLREIIYRNGMAPSQDHFDAFIDKLCDKFIQSRRTLPGFLASLRYNANRAVRVLLCVLALCGLCGYGAYRYYAGNAEFPHTAQEISCVDRLLAWSMTNIGAYNSAMKEYDGTLAELQKYNSGSSVYAWELSFEEYAQQSADRLRPMRDGVRPMADYDPSLLSDMSSLARSQIDLGDMNAMTDAIADVMMSAMIDDLSFLQQHAELDEVGSAGLIKLIEIDQQISECDRQLIFYTLNQSLLPITNSATLKRIKEEYLPEFPSLCGNLTWLDDESLLKGKLDALHRQELELVEQQQKLVAVSEARLGQFAQAIRAEENQQRAVAASEGAPLSERIDATLANIQLTLSSLQNRKTIAAIQNNDIEAARQYYDENIAKQQALLKRAEEMKAQVEEISRAALEKSSPLDTDEPGILWGKGLRLLTCQLNEAAAQCFELYAEREGSEAAGVYGRSAAFFARKTRETGVYSGCIVCMFEEGLPAQAFQIGDILYEVNGQRVRDVEAFSAARGDESAQVSVLRFAPDGSWETLVVPYDRSLGRLGLQPLAESQLE